MDASLKIKISWRIRIILRNEIGETLAVATKGVKGYDDPLAEKTYALKTLVELVIDYCF